MEQVRKLKIISPPATEPITKAEVKTQLRLDQADTSEDALLDSLITAARQYGEDVSRQSIGTQTIELLLDEFPDDDYIEIKRPPLQSVVSIKYKNSAGVETTMTVDIDYIVDIDRMPGRIVLPVGKTWPYATLYSVNPIRIRCTAGYTSDLPQIFKYGMLLHIGYMYKYRDQGIPEIEMAVVNNLYNLRRVSWQ